MTKKMLEKYSLLVCYNTLQQIFLIIFTDKYFVSISRF